MQTNSSTQIKTRPILRLTTQALLLGVMFGALPAQADESRLLVTLKDVAGQHRQSSRFNLS
jgi:hypothetical protein